MVCLDASTTAACKDADAHSRVNTPPLSETMASQMENAATEQLAPATSETHECSVPSPSSTDEAPDASLATSSPEESDQASTTVRLYLSGTAGTRRRRLEKVGMDCLYRSRVVLYHCRRCNRLLCTRVLGRDFVL